MCAKRVVRVVNTNIFGNVVWYMVHDMLDRYFYTEMVAAVYSLSSIPFSTYYKLAGLDNYIFIAFSNIHSIRDFEEVVFVCIFYLHEIEILFLLVVAIYHDTLKI